VLWMNPVNLWTVSVLTPFDPREVANMGVVYEHVSHSWGRMPKGDMPAGEESDE
jgi:hypothetical protein